MSSTTHERHPGYDPRPLTYATVHNHPTRAFWPSRGELVPILNARRVSSGLEVALDDGRVFIADYGSLIYVRPLRRRIAA